MGWRDWFKRKETDTRTDIEPSKIEGKDYSGKPAPIVGDTPSGYVEKAPTPTSGTTTVTYSKRRRGGGGSSRKNSYPLWRYL